MKLFGGLLFQLVCRRNKLNTLAYIKLTRAQQSSTVRGRAKTNCGCNKSKNRKLKNKRLENTNSGIHRFRGASVVGRAEKTEKEKGTTVHADGRDR
ncbi:hypothetical protein QTP88_017093 [Uroleucon formosanum]